MTTLTQSLPVSLGGSNQQITKGFAALLERTLTRLKQHIEYRRSVAELDACSDRMLADIGVYRGDIRSIARDRVYPSQD